MLGAGEFGEVYRALWETPYYVTPVAVKMLKPDATDTEVVKFLQEAAIMGQFRHPHIVRLLGVVTVDRPVRDTVCVCVCVCVCACVRACCTWGEEVTYKHVNVARSMLPRCLYCCGVQTPTEVLAICVHPAVLPVCSCLLLELDCS